MPDSVQNPVSATLNALNLMPSCHFTSVVEYDHHTPSYPLSSNGPGSTARNHENELQASNHFRPSAWSPWCPTIETENKFCDFEKAEQNTKQYILNTASQEYEENSASGSIDRSKGSLVKREISTSFCLQVLQTGSNSSGVDGVLSFSASQVREHGIGEVEPERIELSDISTSALTSDLSGLAALHASDDLTWEAGVPPGTGEPMAWIGFEIE